MAFIGTKGREKGAVDILTEKDARSIPVKIQRNGARRVPGRMNPAERFGPEILAARLPFQLDIDGGRRPFCLVPVGGRTDGITFLNRPGVQFMHDEFATEVFAELRCRADMIDMAMRQHEMGYLAGIQAGIPYVANERTGASSGAGIDHDQLFIEIYDKRCGIVGPGNARAADEMNSSENRFRITHRFIAFLSEILKQSLAYACHNDSGLFVLRNVPINSCMLSIC